MQLSYKKKTLNFKFPLELYSKSQLVFHSFNAYVSYVHVKLQQYAWFALAVT